MLLSSTVELPMTEDNMNNTAVQRKMQRRYAMSPTSHEAMSLRVFCENLRRNGAMPSRRGNDEESSSESSSSCNNANWGEVVVRGRTPRTFGAPSA